VITQFASARLMASGVTVTPNSTGDTRHQTLCRRSWVHSWPSVSCSRWAGFVGCAIVMAIGHHSGNPQWSTRGKMGLLVCLVAALLIGGSDLLINTFYNLGTTLS